MSKFPLKFCLNDLEGREGVVSDTPGTLVIQFRTDTAAFEGHPHEKDAAIKFMLSEAQAFLKEQTLVMPGAAVFLGHELSDANGVSVGAIAHVNDPGVVEILKAPGSAIRIEFDLAAIYQVRASSSFPWGATLIETFRQLEDFKHDVHKTHAVTYQDPHAGHAGGAVSRFKRTEPPALSLDAATPVLNYLHAQEFSTPGILCSNEFADKPDGVFVSVDPVQVVKAKALLLDNPWLQEVVFHTLEHEIHADYTVDSEIHITRDQMNSSEMTLVLIGRFDGEVYNVKLHDGLKTDLTALPELDELEAHCSQESTSDLEPN